MGSSCAGKVSDGGELRAGFLMIGAQPKPHAAIVGVPCDHHPFVAAMRQGHGDPLAIAIGSLRIDNLPSPSVETSGSEPKADLIASPSSGCRAVP